MVDAIRLNLDGEDGKKMRRVLRGMSSSAWDQAANEFGNYKISRIVRSFVRTGSSGQSSSPGGPPGVRSGRLRHSLTYRIAGRVLTVGTNLVYAAILHFGTQAALGEPIRPKRAEALTIPIAPEARGRRARDFENTFVLRRADDEPGEGLIMQKLAGGGVRPLFALRQSVTIAPRPYMGWDARDKSKLLSILDRVWNRLR